MGVAMSQVTFQASYVPEPSTLLPAALGVAVLFARRRIKK
jgi:hypothetical protein